MANRAKVPRSKQPPSTVRVIGGAWRGRRIPFLDLEGLRPTPDRVRETLFNWLSAHCPGARVLDAFAGSGVLGLEAPTFLRSLPWRCRAVTLAAELQGNSFRF